jgi:NDP-sugar pyrophosphorylase family protein
MSTIGMILAAGFGTRLWPLTNFRPKPMMEVAGKPILYYLIRTLENAGIRDIIINLHYKPQIIERYIANTKFKARLHLIHEKHLLGTAGAIKNAVRKYDIKNQSMVIMHGDIMCDIDLIPYLATPHFCLLIGSENQEVHGYHGSFSINAKGDIIELGLFYQVSTNQNQRRQGFFTGIHILSKDAVSHLLKSDDSNLVAKIYPHWLASGHKIKGVMLPLTYDDLGTKERIFAANMAVLKNPDIVNHLGCFTGFLRHPNNIFISMQAKVHENAQITGPAIIAEHAIIETNARIGPNVVVGERSVISAQARIKDSVILSDTLIVNEILDSKIAMSWARISM